MNWEQLKTILWLRGRLTRNQWQRAGPLGAVLAVIVSIGAVVLGCIAFVGGVVAGALGLGQSKPEVLMGVWFGVTVAFLFFWLIGLLSELQRSETIDLQRLMHLPVALGQIFVVNYVASLFVLSVVLAVPGMTGLALGLTYSRGPAMLLLLPLSWSMVFMISAWTYCLRGWLATLMSNPRRRRAVIMGITVGFILVVQLPNLYFNLLGGGKRTKPPSGGTAQEVQRSQAARRAEKQERLEQLIAVQRYVPPLWVPLGALHLANQQPVPALLGTLGCLGIGALGLRRAYRSTVDFYHGTTGGKAAAPAATPAAVSSTAPVTRTLLDARLPFVPEPAAAVALGTFRSMLRAPEVKMAFGSAFVVTVLLAVTVFYRAAAKIPPAAKPLVVVSAMVLVLFMLVQFLANQFGFDRQGFRAYVLSPVERRFILLGKNLATWPITGGFGLVVLVALSVWLRLPALAALAGLFQLTTLLLLGSLGGNLLSMLAPFRVEAGSLKPTKMPALATLAMVLGQFLFPVVMLPVFVPPLLEWGWRSAGGSEFIPVNLLGAVLLAVLTAAGYWYSLDALGRMLRRRELKILNRVTAEQE